MKFVYKRRSFLKTVQFLAHPAFVLPYEILGYSAADDLIIEVDLFEFYYFSRL